MEAWLDSSNPRFAFLILAGAAAAMYVAARGAADALTARQPECDPRGLAVGHWLVIACVGVYALLAGHPEIALSVIFATSVTSLSLVLGIIAFVSPMTAPPGEARGLWPFVLPASVIALLTGLSGRITVVHAAAMLLLGVALLPVAIGRDESPSIPIYRRSKPLASVQLALAMVLAGLAAWAAVNGADRLHEQSRFFSTSLVASILIAPALILPVISSSSVLVHRGHSTQSVSVYSEIVLLNLCLLLPTVALLWYIRPLAISGVAQMSDLWTNLNEPVVYPLILWRLDTFVLVALGLMLFPVSTGRWMLGQREGIGLMVGYGMYLLLTVANNLR